VIDRFCAETVFRQAKEFVQRNLARDSRKPWDELQNAWRLRVCSRLPTAVRRLTAAGVGQRALLAFLPQGLADREAQPQYFSMRNAACFALGLSNANSSLENFLSFYAPHRTFRKEKLFPFQDAVVIFLDGSTRPVVKLEVGE
jgi:hypothetical protein